MVRRLFWLMVTVIVGLAIFTLLVRVARRTPLAGVGNAAANVVGVAA